MPTTDSQLSPTSLLAPEPVDGCDVCDALARQRIVAQGAGDYSKVSDCNVEIRKHPHPAT